MKGFSPFDATDAKAFARSLVRHARNDMPPRSAYHRARLAIASSAAGAAAFGAARASSATVATAAPKLSALTFSLGAAIKWGMVGLVAGGMVLGATTSLTPATRTPPAALAAPPAPTALAISSTPSSAVPTAANNDDAAPELKPTDRPDEVFAQAAPGLAGGSPDPAVSAAAADDKSGSAPVDVDALAAEVTILDEVRGSLLRHAPADALTSLNRYWATFPSGRLGIEASVLRIEAMVQSERHSEAVALAHDFLMAHPRTPFARRVRALVHEDGTNR